MEKRKRIGFWTPAIEIQDRLEETCEELDKIEVVWTNVRKLAVSNLSKIDKSREELSKLDRPEAQEAMFHLLEYRQLWSIIGLLARLAMEQTETHQRLAAVEKSMAELSRRLK